MSKLEILLTTLGRPGRAQVICTVFLVYAFMHAVTMNYLMSFITMTPPYRCKLPVDWQRQDNVSILHFHHKGIWTTFIHDSCHMYVDPGNHSLGVTNCPNGYMYRHREEDFERHTVSTDWDLVCDRKYMVRVFQMSYFVGILLGGMLNGFMCDSFGRRPIWVISESIHFVIGVAFYFDFGYMTSCVLIFILGSSMQSKMQAAFSLALEMYPGKYRTTVGIATFTAPAFSIAIAAINSYFVHDWRTQIIIHAFMGASLIPFGIWFTPESIRWLLAHKRNDKALAVCRSFASFNGIQLPTTIEHDINVVVEEIQNDLSSSKKQSIVDVLRYGKLRNSAFILAFAQFTAQLSIYGFSFLVAEIGGDVYINSIIIGVLDTIMRSTSYFTMKKFGRKTIIIAAMTMMGSMQLLFVVIKSFEHEFPTFKSLSIVVGITGRVSNGIFFCSFFLMVIEVFPTTVRTTCQGMIGGAGRTGLMVTPLTLFLSDYVWKQLPFVLFGVFGLGVALLCSLLPETKGRPLPNTIEEAVRLNRR